jgi:hypothetical protein
LEARPQVRLVEPAAQGLELGLILEVAEEVGVFQAGEELQLAELERL